METTTSKGKEIRIPGPDHPITISPAEGTVRVTVAGRVVAESTRALRLEEKGYPPVYYLPRDDADMSLLVRTKHYTYCPYKGDCTYYSIPIGGSKSEYAVWTYEKPYEAVATLKSTWRFIPRGSMQSKWSPKMKRRKNSRSADPCSERLFRHTNRSPSQNDRGQRRHLGGRTTLSRGLTSEPLTSKPSMIYVLVP